MVCDERVVCLKILNVVFLVYCDEVMVFLGDLSVIIV